MTTSQQQASEDCRASQPGPDPHVWTTTSTPNVAALLESFLEIAWRIGQGQSNGISSAGRSPYSFAVEGLVDGEIKPYVALVCLEGDVDSTLTFSYDQALAYLRERASGWEVDSLKAINCATATVEQLNAIYAVGHDPEKTWIAIVAIEAWFGTKGWRSIS